MDPFSIGLIIVVLVIALIAVFSSLRIAAEYERGVVFRLGRLIPLKGPGLFFIIPFGVDRLVKIDLRTITLEVPPQEIITNDNVTAKVNAVIYFQVVDARRAVTQVLNYINATSQISQTTLRAALGQSTLDELLANREKINQNLQRIIDEQTEPWGIKVAVVEIKDVELPSTMPLPLVIAANTFVGKPWASGAGTLLAAFTVALVALFGLADLAGLQLLSQALPAQRRFAVDAGVIVTAAAAAGFLFQPIRRDMAAFLPIDPENPVHTLALVLSTLLLGTQVTLIAFTDVLGSNLAQPPLNVVDVLEGEAPFLIVAAAGVGILMRRNAGQAAERLGLVVPAWRHVILALAVAGLFLVLSQASDILSHSLTPDIARRVDNTTPHAFGQLGGPLGLAALALLPGICEEVLFRGALQPRIGVLATALLFTSIHTEYGLSIDTLAVLVLALGLGFVRKYTNTTASCACHVSYNLLVGIGIAGAALNVAIVLEVVLIAVSAYAIWRHR